MTKSSFKETLTSDLSGQPGWDAMLEDLLGLNIRGLRTIGAIFATPQKVYQAASSKDWLGRTYTPSLRLFISLVMLVLVLQAFWAGPDSHLSTLQTQAIQNNLNMNAPAELLPFFDAESVWQTALISLPIATISIMLIFALLLRIWGKEVNAVTRVRYYFLTAIPGWIISFLISSGANSLSYSLAVSIASSSFLILIIIDTLSAWRGNPGQYQKFARLWRSGLFGLTNFVVYTLAGIIMFTYSSRVATLKAIEAASAAGIPLTGS